MALFQKDVNPIPSKPIARTQTTPLPGALGNGHASTFQNSAAEAGLNKAEPGGIPSESRLTVGPNIKLKGVEIEDCDTLVVEGYVEASMDSRVIEISESGVYKGTVEIDTAIIKGRFEGELTARDKLIVHATGDVSGKIRYGRLAIEEGGRVHGDLDEIAGRSKNTSSADKKEEKPSANPSISAAAE
ncbi:MAG: polymer-forming cytoskeletal protein [Rhodospirillales bacterium]|jgi:cytoskeletal protein CcmA (bactofilin family)|nr:polymer-forming cytoskeletal protein [Rhodospirillales bacterium]